MNNIERLAAVIELLRASGILIESPYDLENWWDDNFEHTKCWETGCFPMEDEDDGV